MIWMDENSQLEATKLRNEQYDCHKSREWDVALKCSNTIHHVILF